MVDESLVKIVLRYDSGRTIKLEDAALAEWLNNFILGQQAIATLAQMETQRKQQSQEGEQVQQPVPPIINLQEAIARRKEQQNGQSE